MTGKNATPLIGWHSADPDLKPRIEAEAAQRGVTQRELLDEVLADWFARLDEADRKREDVLRKFAAPAAHRAARETAETAKERS